MIVETPIDFDWDEAFGKLAQMPGQDEWEAFVGAFQKAPEGASSTEKWQMMEQMYRRQWQTKSANQNFFEKSFKKPLTFTPMWCIIINVA